MAFKTTSQVYCPVKFDNRDHAKRIYLFFNLRVCNLPSGHFISGFICKTGKQQLARLRLCISHAKDFFLPYPVVVYAKRISGVQRIDIHKVVRIIVLKLIDGLWVYHSVTDSTLLDKISDNLILKRDIQTVQHHLVQSSYAGIIRHRVCPMRILITMLDHHWRHTPEIALLKLHNEVGCIF